MSLHLHLCCPYCCCWSKPLLYADPSISPPTHHFVCFHLLPLLLSHPILFFCYCAFPSHLHPTHVPSSILRSVSLQLSFTRCISLLLCLLSHLPPTLDTRGRNKHVPYPGKRTVQLANGNNNTPGRPSIEWDLGQNTRCHRKGVSHLPQVQGSGTSLRGDCEREHWGAAGPGCRRRRWEGLTRGLGSENPRMRRKQSPGIALEDLRGEAGGPGQNQPPERELDR